MPITTLPPAPEPTDSTSQFNAKSFAWVAALDQFTTEANDLAVSVNNDKNTTESIVGAAQVSANAAASSASNAALSASAALTHASAAAANTNAPLWVSGTTYAAGALVYSAVDGRTYRRKTAGGGTTNPASDSTNWTPLFLEIDTQRPSIRPSLLLDFANTKQLDPRITFSRASTGTYYDGKTVVKAEENLLTYSQEFDNAAWTSPISSATVTANAASAPDGTSTADRLQGLTASWYRAQNVTLTSGSSYTLSMYVKSNTGSSQTFRLFGSSSIASSEFTATTSWQLFTHTFTATASPSHGITRDVANNTVDLLIWGAQLEQRSTVTAYTPTTTAPITNYIPALQTAAANVARFDHDPITGESKGLLIEEQRTNLLTYSEQFDNAVWVPTRVSVASNSIVAPDGTLTGDKLIEDSTANSTHFVYQRTGAGTTTNTNPLTVSIYIKSGGRTNASILLVEGTTYGRNSQVYFDLTSGLALPTTVSGGASGASATITPVGNGWYRCTLTATLGGTDTRAEVRVYPTTSTSSASYTGDGYSGLYIWGAQLEAGSFPTSYIPTTASQVTRSADVASMTGANFSSWYRADEGTVYAESMRLSNTIASLVCSIDDGTASNRSGLVYASFTLLRHRSVTNGTNDVATDQTIPNSGFIKGSFSYKLNDFAFSAVGNSALTDTSGLIPVCNQLNIGNQLGNSGFLCGHIKRLAFYPKRLSNTELQGLTS